MSVRKNAIYLAAACASLLAGCAVGPDFKRPEPPAASIYTLEHSQAGAGTEVGGQIQHVTLGQNPGPEWWKLFKSDALNQTVDRALTGNRTLAAAVLSVSQAEELVNARAGKLYPQVNATGGVGRQKLGAQFLGTFPKPPPFTYFSIGATVSYSLDYTGGVARSIEQQRALVEYQQHQLDAASLSVTGNTVIQALRMASLRTQIATVEGLLDRDRENLKLVQEAFDAGSVSRLDVVSAQSQLASDMTTLPQLRQELSVARHALAVILGNAPSDTSIPEFDLSQIVLPDNIPVSVPSELARRRPDILAAEAQLHAATAAVGVATSNLYPHIDLNGTFGQQAVTVGDLFDSSSSAWSLTSGLVAPLFDGGTLRAEKRAAIDAMRANVANYEQTVLEAFGQVADSLEALNNGDEALQAQARAQQSAQESVDLTRESYHEGSVGILQVLDAERLYQQARLGYVRAQAQRYIDTVQLFLALGGAGPNGG